MSGIFYIKSNDTSPALAYELVPASVDLTGATVKFSMRQVGQNAALISRSAAIVLIATVTPTVKYVWQPGDVANRGDLLCEGEFEVTYADGSIETFPNSGYIPIHFQSDIA